MYIARHIPHTIKAFTYNSVDHVLDKTSTFVKPDQKKKTLPLKSMPNAGLKYVSGQALTFIS